MSRFGGGPRSSMSALERFDDEPPRRAPQRWDRDTFERYARRGPEEFEAYKYVDRESPARRQVDVLDRDVRRGPRGGFEEVNFRYHEEDDYAPPRRSRTDMFHEPTPSEVANQALTPYRRKSVIEKDILGPPARRPMRPQAIRRTSSLDRFSEIRKPYPRYGKEEREQWRPPTNVPIPLPIRRRSPPRRRSPSRGRYHEEEFEDIRYRDLESPQDEFADIRVHRERSTHRRGAGSRYSESIRSEESFEEIDPPEKKKEKEKEKEEEKPQPPGKKGRTKMPKRLVHVKAIEKLGYPYDEEDDFFIVKRALGKEQIDEVIETSKSFKETKKTYRYEEFKEVEVEAPPPSVQAAPPPPPPPPMEPPREVIREVYKEMQVPMPMPMPAPPPPPPASIRQVSPARTVYEERYERIEESGHIGGPLTIVAPRNSEIRGRSDRDIKREIAALEAERRAVKLEREAESKMVLAERMREGEYVEEYEWVEKEHRPRSKSVVRVEKDRKGRMALVRSNH